MVKPNIYIGTSGYAYKWWNYAYYPSTINQLQYYAQDFNTVEINNTFYKMPTTNTINRWNDTTLDNFKFSIKMNTFITHAKKLKNIREPITRFFRLISKLKVKIACILFQFSNRLHFKDEFLDRFEKLAEVEKSLKQKAVIGSHTQFVFEFRNDTFYNEDVYKIFKKHKWAFVLQHNYEAPNLRFSNMIDFINSSDILYIRLHGTTGVYTGSYSNAQLNQLTDFILSNKNFKKVFVYFNNTDSDLAAINNASGLNKKLCE